MLGDPDDMFFDGGSGGQKKPLWSGYRRKKMKNPFSCTVPSFLKRPMKEGSLDTSKQSETSCYTPQLCDRKEEANKLQSQPFVPFISVNKENFGDGFYPEVMVESNKNRIVTNLDVIKNFPSDREPVVFGKKPNDLSSCRVDLN